MTAALFYFNTGTELWTPYASAYDPNPIKAFDTSTGVITVSSTDNTYIPYTAIQLQVVYTSTHVKLTDSDRTASDEFELVVKASCSGNTLTLGALRPDIEYYVGEATVDF